MAPHRLFRSSRQDDAARFVPGHSRAVLDGDDAWRMQVVKHVSRDDLLPLKFSLDHVMKQGIYASCSIGEIQIDRQWRIKARCGR
jgi:hypothetical protein